MSEMEFESQIEPVDVPEKKARVSKEDVAAKKAERETERQEKDAERRRLAEEREAERMAKLEEKKHKIQEVKQKENAVFSALAERIQDKEGYRALVSDAYTELDANVEMAIQGLSYGFIACGRGGVGKTYRILQWCINECGRDNVAYTDSYTTPAGFAVWLYANRMKEVIILDDVSGLLKNDKIVAMLKGALWHSSDGKTRIVNYMTTKPLQDEYGEPVPSMFEIDARIIIITNEINDENPHIKAVLSRVNRVQVDIPYRELMTLLQQIVTKNQYKQLSLEERQEAFDFLRQKTSKKTEELNIRTLLRIMDYRAYAKTLKGENAEQVWTVLSSKLLQQNDRLLLVEKILTDPELKTGNERVEKFIELTGESRATYYREEKKAKRNIEERQKEAEAALQGG